MLIDPKKPELSEKRLACGGFTDLEETQAALTEALRTKARNHPNLGNIRIGSHHRELEKHGRKDDAAKANRCRPTASTRCTSSSAR